MVALNLYVLSTTILFLRINRLESAVPPLIFADYLGAGVIELLLHASPEDVTYAPSVPAWEDLLAPADTNLYKMDVFNGIDTLV
ncbi:hypothetical protein ACFPLB_02610 [Aquamicrobium segne]|uniref:Uncharacterized protein n=1 Tax=Aquamicrobium segne TaxID=469547 RepID=A0ABW0GUB3_9HYPH